jgi:hypothetical protein
MSLQGEFRYCNVELPIRDLYLFIYSLIKDNSMKRFNGAGKMRKATHIKGYSRETAR